MKPVTWIIAGALLGAGCGGAAAPTATRTEARSSLRSAEAVGAEQAPRASYYLELAREQAQQGDEWVEDGKMDRARLAYERAAADAELAIALANHAEARGEAEQVREHIQDMREQHL